MGFFVVLILRIVAQAASYLEGRAVFHYRFY